MSEMVERVAQAICGDDNPANILEIHRIRARAAIEAMREPTAAMVEAGNSSDLLRWSLEPGEGLDEIESQVAWQAMIDEALKDG